MTPEDYDELRHFIHDHYEHIAKRPAMYAGRAEAIESFVFALEMVLSHFGGLERKDRYSVFKTPGQFGNEPFQRYFERMNQCRLGFISNGEAPTALPPEVFQKAFEEHWLRYLESIKKGETP